MFWEKMEAMEKRVQELERELAQPQTLKDQPKYQSRLKELARLNTVVSKFQKLKKVCQEIKDLEGLLKEHPHDPEFKKLYEEEKEMLSRKEKDLTTQIEEGLLAGEEEDSSKDMIVEIRAGTGGEEASLFARDLFRMYAKFATNQGFKLEVMNTNQTGLGGFKEIIFSISGPAAFKAFKYESGTHRVQRVPVTEASGRIHTSAVTVAVLPEPEEVEVELDTKDLRIDTFRSSGPGGQSVNKTDSAVRITHLPTGIVVSCQDEKSQYKNKNKALRILRARLLDKKRTEQTDKIAKQRKIQIGSGDRSEKIRTYNFPDRRITDHRIGLTLHKLEEILDGHLEEIVEALAKEEKIKKLAQEK